MDSFRWTSKYVKFILPNKLKDYDIIIWIDNSQLFNLNKYKYNDIIQLFNEINHMMYLI